jgi:hypothetical protein
MMMRIAAGVMVTALAILASGRANAREVVVTQAGAACPTPEAMIEMYMVAAQHPIDVDAMQSALSHYHCEFINEGRHVQVVRRGPVMSVIVTQHLFSPSDWLYFPTMSLGR